MRDGIEDGVVDALDGQRCAVRMQFQDDQLVLLAKQVAGDVQCLLRADRPVAAERETVDPCAAFVAAVQVEEGIDAGLCGEGAAEEAGMLRRGGRGRAGRGGGSDPGSVLSVP